MDEGDEVHGFTNGGGYDDGYDACPCFWGTKPGSLVELLVKDVSLDGKAVLDLGSGEGKNAVYLSRLGATVEAWEISRAALKNARMAWPDTAVRWSRRDAM